MFAKAVRPVRHPGVQCSGVPARPGQWGWLKVGGKVFRVLLVGPPVSRISEKLARPFLDLPYKPPSPRRQDTKKPPHRRAAFRSGVGPDYIEIPAPASPSFQ